MRPCCISDFRVWFQICRFSSWFNPALWIKGFHISYHKVMTRQHYAKYFLNKYYWKRHPQFAPTWTLFARWKETCGNVSLTLQNIVLSNTLWIRWKRQKWWQRQWQEDWTEERLRYVRNEILCDTRYTVLCAVREHRGHDRSGSLVKPGNHRSFLAKTAACMQHLRTLPVCLTECVRKKNDSQKCGRDFDGTHMF